MDPGWPANPDQAVVCILCRSLLPFNGNVEQFFRHLIKDHSVYHNLNLVLELSIIQPRMSTDLISSRMTTSPPSPPPEEVTTRRSFQKNFHPMSLNSRGASSSFPERSLTSRPVEDGGQVTINQEEVMEFDLTYLANSQPCKIYFPLPPPPGDFSHLDPISIVDQSKTRRKVRQELVNKNNQAKTVLPANPNRHLVSDDLQRLIVSSNPNMSVKFTYSQRLNTQLVLDDFILKKKKGPYLGKNGGRVISWKCIEPQCKYMVTTWEGEIQHSGRMHNHLAQPELYVRKQAYYRVKEDLAMGGSQGCQVTSLVQDVVQDTEPTQRGMLGSVDAMKQAARRYTRKLRRGGGGGDSVQKSVFGENAQIPVLGETEHRSTLGEAVSVQVSVLPVIPGIDPNSQNFHIVEEVKPESIVEIQRTDSGMEEVNENVMVPVENMDEGKQDIIMNVHDDLDHLKDNHIYTVLDELIDYTREESVEKLNGNRVVSVTKELKVNSIEDLNENTIDCAIEKLNENRESIVIPELNSNSFDMCQDLNENNVDSITMEGVENEADTVIEGVNENGEIPVTVTKEEPKDFHDEHGNNAIDSHEEPTDDNLVIKSLVEGVSECNENSVVEKSSVGDVKIKKDPEEESLEKPIFLLCNNNVQDEFYVDSTNEVDSDGCSISKETESNHPPSRIRPKRVIKPVRKFSL